VAEKRVDEIDNIACGGESQLHQYGREKRKPNPYTVHDKKHRKPIVGDPIKHRWLWL
jgi:hypothetical protein